MPAVPAIPPSTNHMIQAVEETIVHARAALKDYDLGRACDWCGLQPDPAGNVLVRFFGRSFRVLRDSLAVEAIDRAPVSPYDEALILRYLAAGRPVRPLGRLVTFRDLPGGIFYLRPVIARTVAPILKTFGNDGPRLPQARARVDHGRIEAGDIGARVHMIGRLDLTFVYRLGDDEFPPTLDFSFDQILGEVYRLDEAAALVHRFTLALINAGRNSSP